MARSRNCTARSGLPLFNSPVNHDLLAALGVLVLVLLESRHVLGAGSEQLELREVPVENGQLLHLTLAECGRAAIRPAGV